jgi:hypothetical protein
VHNIRSSRRTVQIATADLSEQVLRILEIADTALITKAAAILNDLRLEFEERDGETCQHEIDDRGHCIRCGRQTMESWLSTEAI